MATHGVGTIASKSSSTPKTSLNSQFVGRPRRCTNGLSTSGDDSSGSQEPMSRVYLRAARPTSDVFPSSGKQARPKRAVRRSGHVSSMTVRLSLSRYGHICSSLVLCQVLCLLSTLLYTAHDTPAPSLTLLCAPPRIVPPRATATRTVTRHQHGRRAEQRERRREARAARRHQR